MNILIPHQWLLEHLKTKAKPEQIQEYLSLSGPSVESVTDQAGDKVYDIEITTNRPDTLSVRGVAREAVVILTRYELPSELKPLAIKKITKPETKQELPLPKINNDPALCQRIMCVVLANTKHKPTPKWMAQRLEQAGFQVHDSVIDITNYVTHDLGHPCHAFDYDKVMELGGVINVEEAKAGRPFTTLDGESRETVGGEVVFTNDVGTIIDLPAIIGTANSSVDENTHNVLLLLEDINPGKVRQTSMTHAIRTNAAQLNEKELDPYLGEITLQKGISLYREITGAKVAGPIFDEFIKPPPSKTILLKYSLCTDYLGVELEIDQIKQILSSLGCQVKLSAKTKKSQETTFGVTPPSYRQDLMIPVDLVEEIARVYGYQNIPSELMTGVLPVNPPADVDFSIEEKAKQFLAHLGWQEVYTISLVSGQLATSSSYALNDHLSLANPLLQDNSYLRRSLIPSLEEAIVQNPLADQLSVFELAAVYHPQKADLPQEEMTLGLVSTKSYRKVRGDLEALLAQFYINEIEIEAVVQKPEDKPDDNEARADSFYLQSGNIFATQDEKKVALGEIHVLNNRHIAMQIKMAQLIKLVKKHPQYQSLLSTTPIIEDLTFTLPLNTAVGKVVAVIRQTNQLITQVELKDYFQQNYTFHLTYQHQANNLSNEDVQPVRQEVVKQVEKQFQAKLVGKV